MPSQSATTFAAIEFDRLERLCYDGYRAALRGPIPILNPKKNMHRDTLWKVEELGDEVIILCDPSPSTQNSAHKE